MCNYWLYILKHEPQVEGCTLALSISPTEPDFEDGTLQTTNYQSWSELFVVLTKVGISVEMLREARLALDSGGIETVREVPLSSAQLHTLGFSIT